MVLPGWGNAEAALAAFGRAGAVALRAACRRPAHQRVVKYRATSVTAQFATTLCATSVPTIRLTQNRAKRRTRSMSVLSSACSADTENAPVDIHEGIGEDDEERELRSSGKPPKRERNSPHLRHQHPTEWGSFGWRRVGD